MTIKPLVNADFPAVIELYKKCFPKTLMAIMGKRVIQKFLEWCTQDNHYFFIVIVENQPVAFICGYYYNINDLFIHSTSELSKYLRKEMINSLVRQPWKIFHPIFIARLFRQINHQLNKKEGKNVVSGFAELALLSMGVHPDHKRNGYASKMVEFISNFAVQKDIFRLKLTVESDNQGALQFFENNGWSDHDKMPNYVIKYKTLTNA